jgi:hypothetical protein
MNRAGNLLSFMVTFVAFAIAVFAVLICVWWACVNEID